MLTAQLATLLLALSSSGGDVTLLDFRADWCGPCRAMDPVVHQMTAAGYPVRQINIDQDKALAAKYQVQSIPCFVLVANGKELYRQTGMTSAAELQDMFRKSGYDPAGAVAARRAGGDGASAVVEFPAAVSEAPLSDRPGRLRQLGERERAAFRGEGFRRRARADDWIAKCVRLKVADPKGNSVGSGTIIDARQGEALILTCGHIFRDSDGKGQCSSTFSDPALPSMSPEK